MAFKKWNIIHIVWVFSSIHARADFGFWRLPCRGRLALGRMDPVVMPGEVSSHVHTIHGSSGFSLEANAEALLAGDCTSCSVKQDRSAYWTPALYFDNFESGTLELVQQVGGMLVYYKALSMAVEPFPIGFTMIAGDPFQRNFTMPIPDPPQSLWTAVDVTQAALRQKAVGFNCLNYNIQPEGALYRHFMPDKAYLDENCVDGLRMELQFPTCWNGDALDSPDHKSHVAYADGVSSGNCPEGFEKQIPSLFYETIWDTHAFKGIDGQFVLSNGDPTGFGYHGDFVAAWKKGILEDAFKVCLDSIYSGQVEECPVFDIQSEDGSKKCEIDLPAEVEKDFDKIPLTVLPGNVPVEYGPGYASLPMKQASVSSHAVSLGQMKVPGSSRSTPALTTSSVVLTAASIKSHTMTKTINVHSASPSSVFGVTVGVQTDYSVLGTSMHTSSAVVYEIVEVMEEVWVTVEAAIERRHRHRHRHGI